MLRTSQAASRGVESRRDPASHQCPKTRSDALDEATQTRHAKCPDHYLCDTVEQLFMHLSSLGVKWSQVQILSARPRKPALTSAGAGFVLLEFLADVWQCPKRP